MRKSTAKAPEESRGVTSLLEADLIAGMFRPGEWLKQADIESMYNAHRFDVRMALLDLKTRHLIEHIPNRGYRVINLTEREREDLIHTRTVLETAAVRLAVKHRDEEDLLELRTLVERFENAIDTGEMEMLRDLNFTFHDRFYATCGNRILAGEITAMRQRGLPGARGWRSHASIRQSNQDHAEMVRLLEARDADGLVALVDRHLNRWREGGTVLATAQFEA